MPKCGSLGGNQLLIPVGIIGLGPPWICNECTIDPTSHALKYMRSDLGLPTGREAGDQLLESIVSGIENQLNSKFSLRNAENLTCKAIRKHSGTDGEFNDLITKGQHVYETKTSEVHIYFQNGKTVTVSGTLINQWNWAGCKRTVEEIVKNMSKQLKDDFSKFVLPSDFRNRDLRNYHHEHRHLFFY